MNSLMHRLFHFLYFSHGSTGKRELSRVRVALLASGVFLLLLGILLVSILPA